MDILFLSRIIWLKMEAIFSLLNVVAGRKGRSDLLGTGAFGRNREGDTIAPFYEFNRRSPFLSVFTLHTLPHIIPYLFCYCYFSICSARFESFLDRLKWFFHRIDAINDAEKCTVSFMLMSLSSLRLMVSLFFSTT